MNFSDYGLDPRLVEAVAGLGFETPTDIQDATIPPLLEGRDLIGRARTGSGKTAAFGLPLLHALKDGSDGVGALVLAPTRELAMQVTGALRDFAKGMPLRLVCIYGGTPYRNQLDALRRGAQVVVGTPGRVLDLADRGALKLGNVRMFVLDEADEMLNMGFLDDIERVLGMLPKERQVALFSATMPAQIRRIAAGHLKDPMELNVESSAMSVDHIEQRWMKVPQRNKLEGLVRVLMGEPRGSTLVFARTRRGCAEVADALAKRGVSVDALHGDLAQNARERVLARLRSGRLDVVVATDVAARGIDVAHLTHVVNFDLPDDAEGYTHRIGRTGRAGRAGVAISFVTPNELRKLNAFQRALKVTIQEVDVPSDAAIQRLQHEALAASLRSALEDGLEAERTLIGTMDLSIEDVAAAALHLVAAARGTPLDVSEADEDPPYWSRRRENRPRPQQAHRERSGPDATSHGAPHEGGEANEVQLFLPVGKSQGVRAGDLVGALANEGGITGRDIGRVDVHDRVSFVGMSRASADRVLAKIDHVEIRGRTAPILLARPRGPRPEGGDRPARRAPSGRADAEGPNKPWKVRKGAKRNS